jgi:hypothetical protein
MYNLLRAFKHFTIGLIKLKQKENEKHIIHSTFQFVQCLNKSFNSYENNLMTQADCNNIIPRYTENDPDLPGIIPPFELYDVIRKTTHFANQNVQIIIKNMNYKYNQKIEDIKHNFNKKIFRLKEMHLNNIHLSLGQFNIIMNICMNEIPLKKNKNIRQNHRKKNQDFAPDDVDVNNNSQDDESEYMEPKTTLPEFNFDNSEKSKELDIELDNYMKKNTREKSRYNPNVHKRLKRSMDSIPSSRHGSTASVFDDDFI